MGNYDLFIVGNGFDLHFNYKTSYIDFLSYLDRNRLVNDYLTGFLLSAYKNKYYKNEDWNGFEKMICQLLQFVYWLFKDDAVIRHFNNYSTCYEEKFYGNYEFVIKLPNIPNYVLKVLTLVNPFGDIFGYEIDGKLIVHQLGIEDVINNKNNLKIKYSLYVPVKDATNEYVLNSLLNNLKSKLFAFEEVLKKYIKSATKDVGILLSSSKIISTNKVLSFNYSHTAETLFDIPKDRITYVHGDVDNSIILGIEPQMVNNQSFGEESDFIYFFKRFRRILAGTMMNFNNRILTDLNNESVIGIYGHSLDLADKSILLPIFEKRFKRYDLYCYEDVEIYKERLVKMLGLDLYSQLEMDNKINYISN